MDTLPQSREVKLHVKTVEPTIVLSEETSSHIEGPQELELPRAQFGNNTFVDSHTTLDTLLKKSPKEQTQFLKQRANAPTFQQIDLKIQQQEKVLLERSLPPPMKTANDHVSKMCEKSHILSMLPSNPSLDTYFDRDDDISWSDVYGPSEVSGPQILNIRKIFEEKYLFDLDDD